MRPIAPFSVPLRVTLLANVAHQVAGCLPHGVSHVLKRAAETCDAPDATLTRRASCKQPQDATLRRGVWAVHPPIYLICRKKPIRSGNGW
jgi:hypothetical protein